MKKIDFYKLQASGNDFILLDARRRKLSGYKQLARKYCSRKFGVGADGLLVIEPSRKSCFKMRIFNADGSEAEMCGNGARCVGLWAKRSVTFATKAGLIEAKVSASQVKIKMSRPFGLKLDLPLAVLGRRIKVNFINSGVPHTVIFVQGLAEIAVEQIGRAVRFHKKFSPAGTNVNFLEVQGKDSIAIRTYERGVEGETLACGTGAVASAIIGCLKTCAAGVRRQSSVKVKTQSGETLKVYFDLSGQKIDNVWLEGKADLIYKGEIQY